MSYPSPHEKRDLLVNFIALLTALLLVVILFAGIIGWVDEHKRIETAPCSEFKGYTLEDVPARCASYFVKEKQ